MNAVKLLIVLYSLLMIIGNSFAQTLPQFDFTTPESVREWTAAHDVAPLESVKDGMKIRVTGSDPYIIGRGRDYPAGLPLWLRIRLKASASGMGQVFWATPPTGMNEPDSVRFPVPLKSGWQEISVPLPPLGKQTVLRFDPPGGKDALCLVASIAFSTRELIAPPQWTRPAPPDIGIDPFRVQSGVLTLRHSRLRPHHFDLTINGTTFAVSNAETRIGYISGQGAAWQKWDDAQPEFRLNGNALTVISRLNDHDGAAWIWEQKFAPARQPHAITVTTTIRVSAPRLALYLPVFTVLPGVGTFGAHKTQALFAGVEYLDRDEPSSSEADIIGEGSKRQVPDTAKLTLPLMSLLHEGKYLALTWKPDPNVCAVFDSPDRQFHSGGHLMGLLFPGSDGQNRPESSLVPYAPQAILPDKPLTFTATLLAGTDAASIVPSVQQAVSLIGLPPLPKTLSWSDYAALTVSGWLDSAVHSGNQFRHAYPGDFALQPAADAAVLLQYLGLHAPQKAVRARAETAAQQAKSAVPRDRLFVSRVGHIGTLAPTLLYDGIADALTHAEQRARRLLTRFESDGTIPFRKSPNGLDYGKTHFAPDANGLTAQVIAVCLQDALFCGNRELITAALGKLDALTARFANTVPRGAQTWEVPLHTPDILASAHLVNAYTLAYEWTGKPAYLEQARYWAWTGVPFVYLVPPTPDPIGIYATIAVLGATQWVAPNWMGLPVQWCGLVYADALSRFARYDTSLDWKKLADGITASGVAQTWQKGMDAERIGLLPDSFNPRAQLRNDAAINAATVQVNALRLYGKPELDDHHVFRTRGIAVYAPGKLSNPTETERELRFRATPFVPTACSLLLVGLPDNADIRINGQPAPVRKLGKGQQIVTLTGAADLVIRFP